ncbi:MAG: pyridoxamine 5'-phosphate oxidase family protein [Desulfofustis sp.]|jgi:hypothetical protein|nr:pyridoxamine 5'-phosphate oxidase family protein [Desulfofustis sp.]
MELQDYFENAGGTGILATADSDGRVDAAIYSRPHFLDDGTLAFVMRDRLTHANLQSNPYATYLFIEQGPGYHGKRLFLEKTGESSDPALIARYKRRTPTQTDGEALFLVYFKIDRQLPLLGGSPS